MDGAACKRDDTDNEVTNLYIPDLRTHNRTYDEGYECSQKSNKQVFVDGTTNNIDARRRRSV